MYRVISSQEMAELDREAQERYLIPGSILMENAGLKAWQYLVKLKVVLSSDRPIVFAAGSGNNGGDALVAARHAFSMYPDRVVIVFFGQSWSKSNILQTEMVRSHSIPSLNWPEDKGEISEAVKGAALIVDGLSGTGMKGMLRETVSALVSLLNGSPAYRAALDVPSGITEGFKRGSPHFNADVTLTMGLPKISLLLPESRGACGDIVVINPGFPGELLKDDYRSGHLYSFDDFSLPEIKKTAYKNIRGHAAVFAGSVGYTGAPVLASSAAARVRTGLVTLHVDDSIYHPLVSSAVSVMVTPLPGQLSAGFLSSFSAYLAGSGWGMDQRRETYLQVLLESPLPGVVDADGIRHLKAILQNGQDIEKIPKGGCVITPHPGELAFFSGLSKRTVLENPLPVLKELSGTYNLVIVLKSHVTYVAAPDGRIGIIDGMNPAMGTGGSGDILAGIITGFLAQGIPAYEASVQGVLLHQEAGKRCYKQEGWFLSEDLLPYLSRLIMETGV